MELEEIEYHVSETTYVNACVIVPFQPNGHVEYLIAAIVPTEHSFEKEYQLTSAIKKNGGFTSCVHDSKKVCLSGAAVHDAKREG